MATSLTSQQRASRDHIRQFAQKHLTDARDIYSATATAATTNGVKSTTPAPAKSSHPHFPSVLPIYTEALQQGLIAAQIPAPLGGTCNSLLEMSMMVEELYSVDTNASLTTLGTGLGLTPVILAAKMAAETGDGKVMGLVQEHLKPFLDAGNADEGDGSLPPMASLVFSEPQGSANFTDPSGDGLQTVAVEDGDEYVVNGEKIWATNHSGFDDRGADLQCLVCRIPSTSTSNGTNGTAPNGTPPSSNRTQVAILLITRADIARNPPSAFSVLSHPVTLGHRAVNGPHVRYTNLRVPKSQLLAPPNGTGAAIVEATFTGSAALVAAMAVGIMRQAFSIALKWAKTENRGSSVKMIEKQSVADLLVGIKTKLEVTRSIARRAIVEFETGGKLGMELCYEAKLYGAEAAVEAVRDAMFAVGVSSYLRREAGGLGLAELWEDVAVLPIFDGGNVGVRRRQVEALLKGEGYDGLED